MPIPENVENLQRVSAKSTIYQVVCDWIITGVLKPGEKIIDSELAKRFNVSRTPVREAIQILEGQKLVYVVPGRATVVADIDPADIEKCYRTLAELQALAAELGMAIGITFLEAYQGGPRNTLTLFDRFGREALTYAKVHTCDFGEERHLTPGNDFYVAELDTARGPVRVGAMICYDREFPESARILMLKGAELILVPNACPMEINRLAQLRGRAFENMTAIATCNYPGSVPDCNGNSTVFDGMAYLPGEGGSRDTCILRSGEQEGIYICELDLAMLRDYRKNEVFGNAYRHPEKYGLLTKAK